MHGREDGARTHTGRILSPLPLPLGYSPIHRKSKERKIIFDGNIIGLVISVVLTKIPMLHRKS